MKKTHNKLVRDKIPEIIQANGESCETMILNDNLYLRCLDCKLNEEVSEYQESKSMEEIADILEVLMAIAKTRGYSWNDVLKTQLMKKTERGGFDGRVFLKSTESN